MLEVINSRLIQIGVESVSVCEGNNRRRIWIGFAIFQQWSSSSMRDQDFRSVFQHRKRHHHLFLELKKKRKRALPYKESQRLQSTWVEEEYKKFISLEQMYGLVLRRAKKRLPNNLFVYYITKNNSQHQSFHFPLRDCGAKLQLSNRFKIHFKENSKATLCMNFRFFNLLFFSFSLRMV